MKLRVQYEDHTYAYCSQKYMAFAAEHLVFVLELLWDLLFEVAIHQAHRAVPKR